MRTIIRPEKREDGDQERGAKGAKGEGARCDESDEQSRYEEATEHG